MTASKFKVGDLVKHKASGEVGVVSRVCKKCTEHSEMEHLSMAFNKSLESECRYLFTGRYEISIGFTGSGVIVDEFLMEKII